LSLKIILPSDDDYCATYGRSYVNKQKLVTNLKNISLTFLSSYFFLLKAFQYEEGVGGLFSRKVMVAKSYKMIPAPVASTHK
jgi:hypothetical protein